MTIDRVRFFVRFVFNLAFVLLVLSGRPGFAADVETPDFEIADWKVPGDGETPTFMQYLDAKGFEMKASADLVTSTSKGEGVFTFSFEFPPALLQPALTLSYSSEGGMDKEAPFGWKFGGIVEIRRPTSRAYDFDGDDAATWDNEYLVSGPGFSGTLKPSGNEDNRFYLRSAAPVLVTAVYDDDADTWKVHSNGITWDLKPHDGGAATPDGTALWRAERMEDTSGNHVSYVYDADHLIEKISYGGNATTGAAHLVDVRFLYDDNAAVRTDARGGFVDRYEKHVTKIVVGAAEVGATASNAGKKVQAGGLWGSDATSLNVVVREDAEAGEEALNGGRFFAYDLVFTRRDALDFFTKLEREGKTASHAETVAEFEYAEFDSSAVPARTSTALVPSSLGATRSVSEGDDEPSVSETTVSLVDFNRDGLPDVVDSSSATPDVKTWTVKNQAVNPDARKFSWAGPWSVNAADGALNSVTTAASDASPASPAYTTRQWTDVDGDGYADIIESENDSAWNVCYGTGSHFTNCYEENAPSGWAYSQRAAALRADDDQISDWTDADGAEDVTLGLADLNGDGWLDCYDPAAGQVWYHTGEREGGWGAVHGLSQRFEGIRTAKYTIASETFTIDAKDVCEERCEDGCREAADESRDECEDQCEDDTDCEDNCGSDEEYDECVDDCSGGCENIRNRSKYIAASDETGALYDMNGDGLVDFVASSSTPWRVYLNNGRDFEAPVAWDAPVAFSRRVDEGRPDIRWESDDMDVDKRESGSPSAVHQMLIDVDGDGLLDLALGARHGRVWYKNTGSGFAASVRLLPAWWPANFMTANSRSDVDGDSGESESEGNTASMMIDLDHDGAVDYVDTSGVSYGPYPRPGILTKVRNGQGGSSALTYRSLATVSPSGDFTKTQHTPEAKALVDTIASVDSLTGQNAETSFHYADGYSEAGLFRGFTSRRVTRKINGSWTGSVAYEYELDRDFEPLVTTQKLYADSNLNFAPNLARGAQAKALRFEVENAYGDHHGNGAWGSSFRLLKTRKVTETGESGGSKSYQQSYRWDDYGNLKSYMHNGGGVTDDAMVVSFAYVSDAASEANATFFRMASRIVSGTDGLSSLQRPALAHETYYYDGHADKDAVLTGGLLSRAEMQSGWLAGGEALDAQKLAISYTRGRRGELLSATDEATGITMAQTYGFGGAVLETQTNGLGQTITRMIDGQGRVVAMTDPNGLRIEFDFDAFDNVVRKKVTGTGGQTHVYSDTQHVRTGVPYYTMTRLFDESGAVDQTSYSIEDGFGREAEIWSQDENGHYLAVKTLTDLRGLVTTTSHPKHRGTTFSLPTSSLSILNPLTQTYYDALGNARETIRDRQKATGSQLVYFNKPWSETRQDEVGYQTRLTYDAHRRVTKVEQGKSNSFTTTATYRYDALNRLVSFRDGKGTIYTYSYDGAGRLREVKYGGASGGAMTSWYRYDYKGMLKTRIRDNAGLAALWEYDALGRPVTLKVSDSLQGATGRLNYAYEYDTAWKGRIYKTTDPSGTTTYKYDEYGREERVKREYAASSVGTQTPEFLYDADLRGNIKLKTYPSGRRLNSNYAYGHLTSQTAMTSGAADYTLDFGYNQWGLVESIASSTGHEFTSTFTTPLWVDSLKMEYGPNAYQTNYTWANNGLLAKRAENIGTGSAVYAYEYDSLRQLTKMATPGETIENYSYDAAGNPLTMQDDTGAKWTYAAATTLNQIAGRTSSAGKSEIYTYDSAGRVKTWKSGKGGFEYFYDGLGRLRGVTKGGAWQMVLDYDADGNLVRRADNNPRTSTPYYTYSFRDWRYDEKTVTVTENDSAVVSAVNGTRKWFFKGFDGHAGLVFNDTGVVQSQRSLGAYGSVINAVGTTWDLNAFHGSEDQGELFHMGQRHLMQNDGMWLQPEPLLYQGIPPDNLADPLVVATRRYGRNAPTVYQDPTGFQSVAGSMLGSALFSEDSNGDGEIGFTEYAEGTAEAALNGAIGEGVGVALKGGAALLSKAIPYAQDAINMGRAQLAVGGDACMTKCVPLTEAFLEASSGRRAVATMGDLANKTATTGVNLSGAVPVKNLADAAARLELAGDGAKAMMLVRYGRTIGDKVVTNGGHAFAGLNRGGIVTFPDSQIFSYQTIKSTANTVVTDMIWWP